MSLPNLFSRRKRNAEKNTSDVYIYDDIPQKLRIQIIHILSETLGPANARSYNITPPGRRIYESIVRLLRKENGVFILAKSDGSPDNELFNWIMNEDDINALIDGIEVSFRFADTYITPNKYAFSAYSAIEPHEAIDELNARFQESGVGYRFDNNNFIIRVSSEFLHSEVVVPALQLISGSEYSSVNKEFRAAHSSFRSGDLETCLLECAKAFESTLKVIGSARQWKISPTDPASKLLQAAYDSNFIPTWMQTQFNSLKALLESAVPTVRNKMAGHGAGTARRQVSRELAALQLHQTAACIVFLIDHHKAEK